MQSPLLHQVSSLRDSLMHEDPSSMNYHTLPAQPTSTLGLRPRAPHSALPLSSLASGSSSGGSALASTILDISNSNSSNPIADQDQAQPQSKSEQDLAHYLATSNPSQSQPLNREQTLLHTTSLGGEWGGNSVHSLGGMFDRGGGLMAMSMSWGDMNAAAPSPNPNPNPSVTGAVPSSSSPLEATEAIIKPYNPSGEYFLPNSSAGDGDGDIWSLTHSASGSGIGSESILYRVPTVTQKPTTSPSFAPISLPIPKSLLRVNVNTPPHVPISPHIVPSAGVSPNALRSQDSSPFPELGYPEDAEPERYVNLADLVSTTDDLRAPRTRATRATSKRRAEGEERETSANAKRQCLRDRDGVSEFPSSAGSGSGAASKSEGEEKGEDPDNDQESYEGDSSEDSDEDSDSDEDFDADDSGEFVPRSASRSTKSGPRRVKRDPATTGGVAQDEVKVSAKQKQRKEKKRPRPRRVLTGSAAQALRVVTELAHAQGKAEADVKAEVTDSPIPTPTQPAWFLQRPTCSPP
ncbi:hypothetical protein B0H12DRAFT_356404 [Mycena haematopus]|nr:hypothetical protein B0H12DRAFT_356404 [Mycena haematopus]